MLNRLLNHLEEWLITFLIGAATVVIFIAVVQRTLAAMPIIQQVDACEYLWVLSGACIGLLKWVGDAQRAIQNFALSLNLSWAQELCIYMFVWMAKFGAAYGVRNGTHVGVDVLVRKLSPAKAKWLVLFSLLAGALFTGTVGTLGARFVWENGFHWSFFTHMGWDVGDVPEGPTSPDMELPTWIAYSCVPLGSYLMCFRFLQVAVGFLKTGEVPHANHHVAGVDDAAIDDADFEPAGAAKK